MMSPVWPVLRVSLEVSLWATATVMVSSIVLAYLFANTTNKFLKIFEFFVYLPMAMPPVALGYGLLLLLGRGGPLGAVLYRYLGIDIAFTFFGAVVAAFAVSLGLGVRTIRVALEGIDKSQIEIARLLGANKRMILWHIVLPQCKGAIFAGAILVFIRTISEFGATMILAGNALGETRTLALAIWVGMETPGRERESLWLVILAMVISFFALILAEIALRKNKN